MLRSSNKLGLILAFVAALCLATKAPVLAVKAVDDGVFLTAECSAAGGSSVDDLGVSKTDRNNVSHDDCWCATHLAGAAPTDIAFVPAAAVHGIVHSHTVHSAHFIEPAFLRPDATAPPAFNVGPQVGSVG